jgi:eukaryotic-like serine/threonine-protein kinase
MSDEDAELPVGTLVAGKLRVVRALGIGGMGTVYEVEHELTRHRRALKLLHPIFASNHQVVARFLREASAAGRIGSPHIVETFDAGLLDTGEPYLVMEMLDGRTLADLLEETGKISEADAIDWIAQACDGLQAAHDAGIIHRDVKPDNLFIERSGRVKILDFGISKFDPTLTGEKQLTGDLTLGTPYYMAPEQTSKTSSVDARADVYALGVVLYESVTGARPFEAETYPQLIVRIHMGDYTAASSLCPTAALLDAIIAKAMARQPEARFQTPAELARALRDASTATERTQSPFEVTRSSESLEQLLRPQREPIELAATEPGRQLAREAAGTASHVSATTPPAQHSASSRPVSHESTLLSAGSQAPSHGVRRARGWLGWLALAAALAAAGLWHQARSSAPPPTAPPSETALTPTAVNPPNTAVVLASAAPAPPAPVAPSAAPSLPSAHGAPVSLPPTSKSAKADTRAKAHDLEEENPF